MNGLDSTGNSFNDKKKALAYLRSSLAVLAIGILLLSTPILTGFVSSSESSLIVDGYNEKKLLHQMVQNVYAQNESNIGETFEFPNFNLFGSDRLFSNPASSFAPSGVSLKSSLLSNTITNDIPSLALSNVSNITSSLTSSSNVSNITSSSNSIPSSSTTKPLSSTESIQSESLPSSSSPSSNDMISSSYFADKENVQYNYQYPLKHKDSKSDEQIKECVDCFISQLKKLDDKILAEQILTHIKNEFGDLSKLCKLISYGDINRDQLENILYSILFASGNSNNDAYESNTKQYVENEYDTTDYSNEKEASYDDKTRDGYEKKKDGYENDKSKDEYDDKSKDEYDDKSKDEYDDKSKDEYDDKSKDEYSNGNYDNRQLNTYKDEEKENENLVYNNEKNENNHLSNNNNNDYKFPNNKNEDDYSSSYYPNNYNIKIKNNFIQYVLECLFQPPIVYVVWEEQQEIGEQASDILFSFSIDGGLSFSRPNNLSDNGGVSKLPQLATNGDSVYVVWTDDTLDQSNFDVFFAFSSDRGVTFTQPDIIGEDLFDSFGGPEITANGDSIYVAWTDTNTEIILAFSSDRGFSWSQPENLSDSSEIHTSPEIATNGDSVYVVWRAQALGVWFSFSSDRGLSWSQPDQLSTTGGGDPAISANGDNVYLAWVDDGVAGKFDIFFAFSSDRGVTFNEPENISETPDHSCCPEIAANGDSVYVVWREDVGGTNEEIFFTVSSNRGLTFSQFDNLSDNTGQSTNAKIAANGDSVYVVWDDDSVGDGDILFSFSNDRGMSFSQPENVSHNTGFSRSPTMATNGDNIFIVWLDATLGVLDILFSFSNDRGASFSEPDNITNSPENSELPQVDVK